MALGEVLLRSTLITMAPSVFQKTNFQGYFSQSQTSKCLMRFFGSGTGPWAQISWEGTIFDAKHDDSKIFPIFENFGKSRNKVWVPPIWRPHLRGENCFRVIRDMSDCISFSDGRNESLLVILITPFDHRVEIKTVIENMFSKICRTRRLVLEKSSVLKG